MKEQDDIWLKQWKDCLEDFEEERRLLYVAMTRARHHLELLYTTGTKLNPRPPSRFLSVYGIRSFVSS